MVLAGLMVVVKRLAAAAGDRSDECAVATDLAPESESSHRPGRLDAHR